jgi:alpha-L-rhamnosidase
VTDKSWTSDPGPVTADDLYSGQDIDAGMRTTPGCAPDSRTRAASTPSTYYNARLNLDAAPPVQRVADLHPRRTRRDAYGALLLAFGQNVVGWLELRARGVAGTASRRGTRGPSGQRAVCTAAALVLAADHFILSGCEDAFEPAMVSAVVIDARPVLELSWCSLVLLRSTVVVRRSAG